MNKILKLTALAFVAFTFAAAPAVAQQYGAIGTMVSAGVVVSPYTGSSYTSNYSAIACTKYEEVYLALSCYPSNTSSGQIKITWSLSPDGTKLANQGSSATNYITLQVGTAADQINWGTNLWVGSAGYVQCGIIGATNSTLTNVTFKVYAKPKRNG